MIYYYYFFNAAVIPRLLKVFHRSASKMRSEGAELGTLKMFCSWYGGVVSSDNRDSLWLCLVVYCHLYAFWEMR